MVRLLVFERKERSVTGNWAVVERFLFCQLFHDLLVELFELDMVFLRDAGFAAIETQRAGGDELVRVAVERAQVDAEHAGECGTRGAQAQRGARRGCADRGRPRAIPLWIRAPCASWFPD